MIQGCIIPPWLFNVYMILYSDEEGENGDRKEASDISGGRERVEVA